MTGHSLSLSELDERFISIFRWFGLVEVLAILFADWGFPHHHLCVTHIVM